MTRTTRSGLLGLAVAAAFGVLGCDHLHKHRGVPIPPPAPPAIPAPVTALRLDGAPVTVAVPPQGITLRDAVEKSGVRTAAAEVTDPAYLFVVLDRPEARYSFSLPVVLETSVGLVRLRPGES